MRLYIMIVLIPVLLGCSETVMAPKDEVAVLTLSGVLGDHESGLFITPTNNAIRYWIIPIDGTILTVHVMSSLGIMLPANWMHREDGIDIFRSGTIDKDTPYYITYIKNRSVQSVNDLLLTTVFCYSLCSISERIG